MLAKKLARELGVKFILLDCFLQENGAPYCEQIEYDILQKTIFKNPRIIIEGVLSTLFHFPVAIMLPA